MIDGIMSKVVMNGSTVDMLDKVTHDEIRNKVDKLYKVFYEGDPLTDFE